MSWPQGLSEPATREVRVLTVESKAKGNPPQLKSDLAFLRFSLTSQNDARYTSDGTYQREYRYRAELIGDLPGGVFAGDVLVVPDWPDDKARIPVHGEVMRPVRVVPSHPVLHLKNASDSESEMTLCVMTNEPDPAIKVEITEDSQTLLVRRVGDDSEKPESTKLAQFSVRLRPGSTIPEGVHRLAVRSLTNNVDRMTFPITVMIGGSQ
jgi:hypothetical protein